MKPILLISSLFILPGISSYHFLKDKLTNSRINYIQKPDKTRIDSKYYGLDWGSRTDEIIEEKLDTGDLVFYSREDGIFNIILNKLGLRKESKGSYNHIGMIIRLQFSLYIVEVYNNKNILIKYEDLLSNQTIESIKIRKKRVLEREAKENKENQSDFIKNSSSSSSSLMIYERIKDKCFKSSSELVNEYFFMNGHCDKQHYEDTIKQVNEININSISNKSFPLCLSPMSNVIYDYSIVIRSRNK